MVTRQYPEFGNLVHFIKQNDEIMALYLIGSCGTPFYGPLSDLDFAVLTKKALDFTGQLSIQGAFSAALEKDDVDMIFLN